MATSHMQRCASVEGNVVLCIHSATSTAKCSEINYVVDIFITEFRNKLQDSWMICKKQLTEWVTRGSDSNKNYKLLKHREKLEGEWNFEVYLLTRTHSPAISEIFILFPD